MRLLVFNGSPRGKGSNTKVFLEHFLNGFMEAHGNTHEIVYLNHVKNQDEFVKLFRQANHVLLAFPLYTDAMPAVVKTFIESLQPLCGLDKNKTIGFIVQSGFGEAIHSRYVERYLQKLAARLDCCYTGTIVRGGGEGIKDMPPIMTKGVLKSFQELGSIFGETGIFDKRIMRRLAKRDRFSPLAKLLLTILAAIGFLDSGWNSQLKKNGAYEKRFNKPYTREA
jgi:6-phosphogluconate dehydrogenase